MTYDEVINLWKQRFPTLSTTDEADPEDQFCWESLAAGFAIAHGLEGDDVHKFSYEVNQLEFY